MDYAPTYFGTSVPEVVDIQENEDGTMTLTVEVVCDMVICNDAVITHEFTVRFAEDGSFQYLGNEIKKLKLVGILATVVMIGGVISIPLVNNHIAYKRGMNITSCIHGEVVIPYWMDWIFVDINKKIKSALTMKKFIKIILCIMGVIIALLAVFWFGIPYVTNYKKTTCDTSVSPDGKYELTLQAVGEPDWPFGSASGRSVLKEGKEQFNERVILYFDGTKEIPQLTDTGADYISGEGSDGSRVIAEQSFDVDLNDRGEVRFVSYLPIYDTLWEDVSFVLAKDEQIVYHL